MGKGSTGRAATVAPTAGHPYAKEVESPTLLNAMIAALSQPGSPWPHLGMLADKAAGVVAGPAIDAYTGMSQALGHQPDPNAPAGYVTHDALSKGAQGLAELAAGGGTAFGRAPRGAIRSNSLRSETPLLDRYANPETLKTFKAGTGQAPAEQKSWLLSNKVEKSGDEYSRDIYGPNGEHKGYVSYSFLPTKARDKLRIEMIEVDGGPNSIGPRGLIELKEQFKTLHPNVNSVSGYRTSGARKKHGGAKNMNTVFRSNPPSAGIALTFPDSEPQSKKKLE